MTLRVKVTLKIVSDFHLGTGAGRGRTVDATVLRDERGTPYVPASALKGLTRWHARSIADVISALDVAAPVTPDSTEDFTPFEELFGREGGVRGRVDFGDALAVSYEGFAPLVHGHSTRDRHSGRSQDQRLYFTEDAAATTLEAELTTRPGKDLSSNAILLLLLALRRIEALGGQRRRGKGRAHVTVEVTEGMPEFLGLRLPEDQDKPGPRGAFARLYDDLTRSDPATPGDSGHGASLIGPNPELSAGPDASSSVTDTRPPFSSASGRASHTGVADNEVIANGASGNASDEPWTTRLVIAQAGRALVLGHDQGVDNVISTFDFIPGSSLRGAIAAHALQHGWKAVGAGFRDVFVREQVSFGPLYPLQEGWSSSRTVSMPSPYSFQTCKDHRGAIVQGAFPAHGVADLLAAAPPERCGKCEAPLEPLEGYLFLERTPDRYKSWRHWQPPLQTILRSAIDKNTQRGANEQLYATESIPPFTWFAGYIWGRASVIEALETIWDRRKPLKLHVGKCQTRGHGEVLVWLRRPAASSDSVYPLLYPAPSSEGHRPGASVLPEGFTITCYSDLIVLDAALRPVGRLDEHALWWLLGQAGKPPFRLESGFARTRQVSGFNGVPGVRRTTDQALAAGSVWRFAWVGTESEDQRQKTWDLLEKAHRRGLGLRRGEGFGRILLNLPWHQAGVNQLQAADDPSRAIKTPDWAVDVDAEIDQPAPVLVGPADDDRIKTSLARPMTVHPSPTRIRRHEGDESIEAALLAVRLDRDAVSRWLYQASLAAEPRALLAKLREEMDRSSTARPRKESLRQFHGLIAAVLEKGPGTREELQELLRDLSEALAERAAALRAKSGPASSPGKEAADA
jgi:CRISPR/Cas system CSM-associated protein Csm3 (group 7 of RAMP superfamily)